MIKLHYPEARNWMWDYCTYLGPFIHCDRKYDLGVYIHPDNTLSYAIVYGNEPGNYISGCFSEVEAKDNDIRLETYKRAKYLEL